MRLDYRMEQMLSFLYEDKFVTVEYIARQMQVSEKTVRNLSKQLEVILSGKGCVLERKYGKGLRLQVKDRTKYTKFCINERNGQIPVSSEQRVEYLILLFIRGENYIKTDELCNRLFVSRKTISSDIKIAEGFLGKYDLSLKRRPHYGLKLVGKEISIRGCLSELFYTSAGQGIRLFNQVLPEEQVIEACIVEGIHLCGYTIYDSDRSNLILQLRIAIYRIEDGHMLTMEEVESVSFLQESDIKVARTCADRLMEKMKIALTVAEIKYLAIQLSGKKKLIAGDTSNIVIDMEINQLVNDMLDNVNKTFQMDLRSDFELQTSLRQHLVSLRVRLLYHLKLENPMLMDIKTAYSFPYAVAAQAATVLSEHFHSIVNEDEVGYLALCFALSLERQRKEKNKWNILLVCASGMGGAKLFEYRFREVFGTYLGRVETCDINRLTERDFSNTDYIFSTVPVECAVPIPVYQVQYFFDRYNVGQIRKILEEDDQDSIKKYFSRDLFFTELEGTTKQDILHKMCSLIAEHRQIPEEFEEWVMHREKIMQTDFCNQIAIPHPYMPLTQETFVCVALLKRPVHWQTHDVQVVFLLSISTNKENLERFYKIAPAFMMDETSIQKLIKEKKYETLLYIIYRAEEERRYNGGQYEGD